MSNSMSVPRCKTRIASPLPLPLTSDEAETLRAAVQRIIRASEAVEPPIARPGTKKSPRR